MRPSTLAIQLLTDPAALASLAVEATLSGHGMVTRLLAEWSTGENRFDRPGERSYIAMLDGNICGVCGLNVDPFAGDGSVGRVRRLYVSTAVRRRGVGSAIMAQLMRDALGRFRELNLRTHDAGASAFYVAVGFSPVSGVHHCTHRRSVVA